MAYQLVPGMFQPVTPQSPGDTTFTKVFVGGLAWETRSDSLRRYFEQFGVVLEADVIRDKNTGRSKGYGFVTFQDPEAAKRACADPTPLIDGRWANCNLASFGRHQLIQHYGHLKPYNSYVGGLQIVQSDYHGNFQPPLPHSYYRQGYLYPTYGHAAYGPKYVMPPFLPMYEAPGATIPAIHQYGRLGQTVASSHGYSTVHGCMMPCHHSMQFSGFDVNGIATSTLPLIQPSYPSGNVAGNYAQPRFLLPVPSVLFSDLAQIVG
ncbi:hypothetical protein SAY87_021873 [Trapa incisa]|uniref:RRM domain-containing protein n=1 Tax=Trapa incisa TaxID=236973 RepID=A0AAN7JRN5_9MYRT|nr:hypothetical protein SAY87_021873 [Trapa incisa]